MSKNKELTESEMNFIIEQSGMDISIVKSWYKGKTSYNFKGCCGKSLFDWHLYHLYIIEFLQQCPKGKMKKKDFYKFYKLLRGSEDHNLSKISDRVFSCFDKDGSGSLDFSEVIENHEDIYSLFFIITNILYLV